MKTMQKLKALAVLAGAVALMFSAQAATKKIGKYTWTYKVVKGAAQIGNGKDSAVSPEPKGAVTVPSKIGKYDVKSIGPHAFDLCQDITSVTIPKGVTNIGEQAFVDCHNLKSVSIPSSVKSIGRQAFSWCCSLQRVTTCAKDIEWDAFSVCTNLQVVTLQSGVSTISKEAFRSCSNLQAIYLPHSLQHIYPDAFINAFSATGAKRIYIEDVEDEDRFKEMLKAAGRTDADTFFEFILRCKLTLKPNNTKYGNATLGSVSTAPTSSWYVEGEEMPLVAKAKSGYVFAGWYQDKTCKTPIDDSDIVTGDYRKAKITLCMPSEHTTIYAKFITKAADKKALKFNSATKNLAKTTTNLTPESCNPIKITASSASRITYSATGLPTGLSIDDETGQVYGSPRKPGTFTATITVKSTGGYKITQKIKITVEADRDVWGVYDGYAQPGAKASDPPAKLTFSVSKYGKVTGKVNWKDTAYPFTAQCTYSIPGLTKFSPSIKIGKTTFKPGVVMISYDDDGYRAFSYVDGKQAFNAYQKASLFAEGGPLESCVGTETTLTAAHDASGLATGVVDLKVRFNSTDTATIAGTINGKPVNFSAQLSLKEYNGDTEFDLVVPVILYKYRYYRSFCFTFLRSGGSMKLEESAVSIQTIDYIR